jgi:hypothetical protein
LAEIFFFPANNKLVRLTERAFHHTCHHDLLMNRHGTFSGMF